MVNLIVHIKYMSRCKLIMFLLFAAIYLVGYSQDVVEPSGRRVIDSTAIKNWIKIGDNVGIESQAGFFYYTILCPYKKTSTLVLQSLNKQWTKKFHNVESGIFS